MSCPSCGSAALVAQCKGVEYRGVVTDEGFAITQASHGLGGTAHKSLPMRWNGGGKHGVWTR